MLVLKEDSKKKSGFKISQISHFFPHMTNIRILREKMMTIRCFSEKRMFRVKF